MTEDWIPIEDSPGGAGGYVWVAYRNPNHPEGWNLRIQSTPIMQEMVVKPEFWKPVQRVDPPKEKVKG